MSRYGRLQVAEPPANLRCLHLHRGGELREVDHEPKCAVLDQQDLLQQRIYVDKFIPGARRVDALGSCTANATIAHSSTVLSRPSWLKLSGAKSYQDARGAEIGAIRFYHICSDQTGDPAQEWPPTDCGSSGPYIASEMQRLGFTSGQRVAHGPQNVVSLLQSSSVLQGTPFLNVWEEPGPDGMIDGNGSVATLEAQIARGVAGGHETVISAIEKLVLLPTGDVDPWNTIVRVRNSWSSSWGLSGSFRAHLSTFTVVLAGYCDFRSLVA